MSGGWGDCLMGQACVAAHATVSCIRSRHAILRSQAARDRSEHMLWRERALRQERVSQGGVLSGKGGRVHAIEHPSCWVGCLFGAAWQTPVRYSVAGRLVPRMACPHLGKTLAGPEPAPEGGAGCRVQ